MGKIFKSDMYPALRVILPGDGGSAKFAGGRFVAETSADAAMLRKFAKENPQYGIKEAKDADEEAEVAADEVEDEASDEGAEDEDAEDSDEDEEADEDSDEEDEDANEDSDEDTDEEEEAVDLGEMTVPELQELARKRDLPVGGNKSDLIERLSAE